jgi:hypothetical protein
MISIKRVALIVALLAFILPGASLAEDLSVEIYASSEDIDLKISRESPFYDNYMEAGFGLYYGEDYLISNVNLALKGEVATPGLTLGLGFKGLLGEVEIQNRDLDLRAISFLVLGEYDFEESFFNLPVNISMSISMAPEPLCFSDTDRYLEFYSAIYLYIVKNGAIGIIYRSFEAHFEGPSGEVKESDDAVLLGIKLTF